MLFTNLERMAAFEILPKEGSFLTAKLLHKLRMELSFSEDENKKLNVRKHPSGGLIFNDDKVPPKEIEVGDKVKEIILAALKELDKQGKISEDYLSLCEKLGYEGANDSC